MEYEKAGCNVRRKHIFQSLFKEVVQESYITICIEKIIFKSKK
jgi:hypothetical protein